MPLRYGIRFVRSPRTVLRACPKEGGLTCAKNLRTRLCVFLCSRRLRISGVRGYPPQKRPILHSVVVMAFHPRSLPSGWAHLRRFAPSQARFCLCSPLQPLQYWMLLGKNRNKNILPGIFSGDDKSPATGFASTGTWKANDRISFIIL